MSQPRIGIVIRTKDRPLFVTRAVQSVLQQTYTGWSVVLVNDGGNAKVLDATLTDKKLSAPFKDGRMTVMSLAKSVGRSEAFNRGARALGTEFVCCLDDDDTWDPSFLAQLLKLYDDTLPLAPDLGGVASLVTAVREDIVTEAGVKKLLHVGTDDLPHTFKRSDFFLNPIAYATYRHDLYPVQWMLKREAALQVGGFPVDFDVMEDRAFMNQFLQHWRLAILDKPLAYHHRRINRSGDTSQTAMMNTLDNPSYDWRLYSDLAKITVNSPVGPANEMPLSSGVAGDLIRSSAATIIKELNDETSALWHKLNGEAMAMRARIDSLEARLGSAAPMQEIETPPSAQVWSLWNEVGETDRGYVLSSTVPFLDRFTLSMADDQPGILFHASPSQQRMVLQMPRTLDHTALELSLGGLGDRNSGLRCEFILSGTDGYLFQTGLYIPTRDRLRRTSWALEEPHVHACPSGGSVKITRDFSASQLQRSETPKLSIVLPRQALDFQFCCRDLVVSRIE